MLQLHQTQQLRQLHRKLCQLSIQTLPDKCILNPGMKGANILE